MKKLETSYIVAIVLGVLLAVGLLAGIVLGIRSALEKVQIADNLTQAAQSAETTRQPAVTLSPTQPPEASASPASTQETSSVLSHILDSIGELAVGQGFWYGDEYEQYPNVGKSWDFPGDGVDQITIDMHMGAVAIRPSDDQNFHFVYDAYLNDSLAPRHTFSCLQNDTRLEFSQSFTSSLESEPGSRIQLTVLVPATFLGRIEMQSASGYLEISDICAKDLDIEITDGAVQADSCTSDNVSFSVTNGNIDVVSGYGLMWQFNTVNGDITASALDVLSFSAACAKGNIDLGCTMLSPTGSLRTGYGDVSFRAPEDAEFAFSMETYWGSLEFDGAFSPVFDSRSTWSAKGRVGGGFGNVEMVTMSGDVGVRALPKA